MRRGSENEFVTNDRMRDHLFHAEEEEASFRVFREERQIRYTISPVNNQVSFRFPLGYSVCVQVSVDEKNELQETKNGFHLPLGRMEKTEFRIQKWYCFRNKAATIVQLMKRVHWSCLFSLGILSIHSNPLIIHSKSTHF